jgi:hypothetical protein
MSTIAENRHVFITWKGEEHKIKATFELIDALESRPEPVNIGIAIHDWATGDTKLTQFAKIIAKMLRYDGVVVTAEQVYAALYATDNEEAAALRGDVINSIALALIPPQNKKKDGEDKASE